MVVLTDVFGSKRVRSEKVEIQTNFVQKVRFKKFSDPKNFRSKKFWIQFLVKTSGSKNLSKKKIGAYI